MFISIKNKNRNHNIFICRSTQSRIAFTTKLHEEHDQIGSLRMSMYDLKLSCEFDQNIYKIVNQLRKKASLDNFTIKESWQLKQQNQSNSKKVFKLLSSGHVEFNLQFRIKTIKFLIRTSDFILRIPFAHLINCILHMK